MRLKGAHGGAHGRHQRELAALGDVAEGDTGDDGRHDFCCVFFFEEGRVVCRCRVTERKVAGIQEDGVVMFLKGTDGRCCVILCGDAGEGELVTREACSATLFLYLPGTSLNDHGLAPAGGALFRKDPYLSLQAAGSREHGTPSWPDGWLELADYGARVWHGTQKRVQIDDSCRRMG